MQSSGVVTIAHHVAAWYACNSCWVQRHLDVLIWHRILCKLPFTFMKFLPKTMLALLVMNSEVEDKVWTLTSCMAGRDRWLTLAALSDTSRLRLFSWLENWYLWSDMLSDSPYQHEACQSILLRLASESHCLVYWPFFVKEMRGKEIKFMESCEEKYCSVSHQTQNISVYKVSLWDVVMASPFGFVVTCVFNHKGLLCWNCYILNVKTLLWK